MNPKYTTNFIKLPISNTNAKVASQTETYEYGLTGSHVHKNITRCQQTHYSTQRYDNTNVFPLMSCVTESSSPQQNKKNNFHLRTLYLD
jgi:hypothetical protein